MRGMTRTPYLHRSYRVIKSRKPDYIKAVESEMIEDFRNNEIKLGLEISNRRNEFKLTTLKYLHHGWGILSLKTTGDLS